MIWKRKKKPQSQKWAEILAPIITEADKNNAPHMASVFRTLSNALTSYEKWTDSQWRDLKFAWGMNLYWMLLCLWLAFSKK